MDLFSIAVRNAANALSNTFRLKTHGCLLRQTVTPCMRELGMWDSGDGIDTAFADIEELSHACKYADCTHTAEPGCAVLLAIEDGTLDPARLESYRKLKTENDYAADSSRYLEAKRAKFKEIAKINKSGRKNRC